MDQPSYRERLRVPVRWWVLCAGFVASLWVACAVAAPRPVAAGAAAGVGVAVAGWLIGYGSVELSVSSDGFRAGRALLPWAACGQISELDVEAFRTLRGPGADARAWLLLRPYLDRAVRVDVRDDADPTPYWLVVTRHPERLATALRKERARSLPEENWPAGVVEG